MSSFSRKHENMDVERGNIQSAEEHSIRSADQIPEIKVDQSQVSVHRRSQLHASCSLDDSIVLAHVFM